MRGSEDQQVSGRGMTKKRQADEVAKLPWDRMNSQMFDTVFPEIAKLITEDDDKNYILPILESIINIETKQILSFWSDYSRSGYSSC